MITHVRASDNVGRMHSHSRAVAAARDAERHLVRFGNDQHRVVEVTHLLAASCGMNQSVQVGC